MRSVGIKALKNQLSAYIRLAAGGETVLICDRDVVVAELRGPQHGRAERVNDALLADLIRRGLISPAGQKLGGLPQGSGKQSLSQVLRGLDDDREDR